MQEDREHKPSVTQKVIRDKDFARRLEIACEEHNGCPTELYRGKQKWIYEQLKDRFDVTVSPEAVRKWFSGESRPRPKIMSFLALLLEVDEAWLSLGIAPELTPIERRQRNSMATGALNYVAGVIQLSGGSVAFPDDETPQLFAIIMGKRVEIEAVLPFDLGQGQYRATIGKNGLENKSVILVVPQGGTHFSLMRIPNKAIHTHGVNRGEFYEVPLSQQGFKWMVGNEAIEIVTSVHEIWQHQKHL